jgi:hypothetical protein
VERVEPVLLEVDIMAAATRHFPVQALEVERRIFAPAEAVWRTGLSWRAVAVVETISAK